MRDSVLLLSVVVVDVLFSFLSRFISGGLSSPSGRSQADKRRARVSKETFWLSSFFRSLVLFRPSLLLLSLSVVSATHFPRAFRDVWLLPKLCCAEGLKSEALRQYASFAWAIAIHQDQ